MKNIIEIDHITKDYGNGRGVFDISFQVKKGEVLGFLGPTVPARLPRSAS